MKSINVFYVKAKKTARFTSAVVCVGRNADMI